MVAALHLQRSVSKMAPACSNKEALENLEGLALCFMPVSLLVDLQLERLLDTTKRENLVNVLEKKE